MSVSTGKLRLGPLPKIATVKVTIALTTALKTDLEHIWTPLFVKHSLCSG